MCCKNVQFQHIKKLGGGDKNRKPYFRYPIEPTFCTVLCVCPDSRVSYSWRGDLVCACARKNFFLLRCTHFSRLFLLAGVLCSFSTHYLDKPHHLILTY